jgi:hypothetical protein
VRSDYLVDAGTARRMARASVVYRVTSPAIYGAVLLELAIAVGFLASGRPVWGIALAAFAISLPVILWVQAGSLARTMQHRGFRPGTLLSVEWEPETFTVETPDAAVRHRYDHVSSARDVAGAVVLRMRDARILLLLPTQVVPDYARPRLSARL